MICCNPRKGLNYYFEMPYFKGFRIEIENIGTSDASIYYRIDCEEKEISPDSLYFHAQFRRINPLPYKQVYTILDSIGDQGQYVGTYLHCGAYNFDVDGKYTEFSTPYTGLTKVRRTDDTYRSQKYFDMYRRHITDSIYFKKNLRVTIQALAGEVMGGIFRCRTIFPRSPTGIPTASTMCTRRCRRQTSFK